MHPNGAQPKNKGYNLLHLLINLTYYYRITKEIGLFAVELADHKQVVFLFLFLFIKVAITMELGAFIV